MAIRWLTSSRAPTDDSAASPEEVAAALAVVSLWIPSAVLNFIFPGQAVAYGLGLFLAGLSVAFLWLGRESPAAAGLRLRRPSRATVVLLGLSVLAALPAIVLAGRIQAWDAGQVLVAAPASAIGQEVYFRGTLQYALRRLTRAPAGIVMVLQAALFAAWHVRAFREAPPEQAVAVLVISLAVGAMWGWLALRDGTIAWVALHHTFFLALQ